MKNKFSLIIICLYTLILILLAFSNEFIESLNWSIISKFSLDNPLVGYKILKYTETGILYICYGILMMLFCIDFFDKFKYILLYSILLSLLLVIINVLIKSFYMDIDFLNSLIAIISVLLGIGIELLVKLKQIRGENNEE